MYLTNTNNCINNYINNNNNNKSWYLLSLLLADRALASYWTFRFLKFSLSSNRFYSYHLAFHREHRGLSQMSHKNNTISVTQEELEDLLRSRTRTDRVPTLRYNAEERIRRELRDVAMRGCASEIEAFAECAKGKIVSVVWTCRSLNVAVDKCMKRFANDKALRDEMRRRHALKYPKSVTGYREHNEAEPTVE